MKYLTSRLLRLWNDEGGWIGPALMGISALGSILGGGGKASSDSRNNQAMQQLLQDKARTDQYGIGQDAQFQQANTDLARKGFEEDARGSRAKQAIIGALLGGGLQDVNIDTPGIPKTLISGGLRPSALGESGRAGGQMLNQQALMKMLQGDTYQGGNLIAPPQIRETPKAGWLEKLGGIAGTVGGIAGGLGTMFPQGSGQQDTGQNMTPELRAYMDSILNNSGNTQGGL